MALQSAYHIDETGMTLYAFPVSELLSTWLTNRVALTETPASSKRYTGSLEDTTDTLWLVFSGTAEPSDYNEHIGTITLSTGLTTAQNAQLMTLTSVSSQNVRDAMKLAPSAGSPDAGSIDEHLDNASTFDSTTDDVNVGSFDANAITAVSIAANAFDGKGDWAVAASYTAARALYLDNLDIGENVSTQTSVDNIGNAVRNKFITPNEYQIPGVGSERFKITAILYKSDNTGLEDADSNTVTVSVENAAGTDRSGNLYDASSGGSATTTMNRLSVGHYELWYEVDTADPEEQLNWIIDYDISAAAQKGASQTNIVTTATAGGFGTTDRTKLTTLYNDWLNGGRLDLLIDAVSTHDAAAVVTALKADSEWSSLTTIDTLLDQVKATVVDKLDDTFEDVGGGVYRFTTASLANAPTASGGGATAQQVWEYTTRSLTEPVTITPTTVISLSGPDVDETTNFFTITQLDDYGPASTEVVGPIRVNSTLPLDEAGSSLRFGATKKIANERYDDAYRFEGTASVVNVSTDVWDITITILQAELPGTLETGIYGWDVEIVFTGGEVSTVVRGELELTESFGNHA